MSERTLDGGANGAPRASVRSVRRALQLLLLFNEDRPSMQLLELVDASGLAKTTVLRLVATLQSEGFLHQRRDGVLVPGTSFLRIGALAIGRWQMAPAAEAVLADLANATGETACLYHVSNVRRVCVGQHEGSHSVRHLERLGELLPLWTGASSVALLSDKPDAFAERVASHAPAPARVLRRLQQQIAIANEAGYAVDHGGDDVGASSLAAPVHDTQQAVVATIAITGPTSRFGDADVNRHRLRVLAAAARLIEIGEVHPLVLGGPS